MALVNWSPQIYSHLFCSLFELQLILWQFDCCRRLFSTRPQIRIESETGKFLISKFLQGLTHSAVAYGYLVCILLILGPLA